MNSAERHRLRYIRRKMRREAKRKTFVSQFGDFEKIFSYRNLFKSGKKCSKGVKWKASVQNYLLRLSIESYKNYVRIRKSNFRYDRYFRFTLYERRHERLINASSVRDRVINKCLCDYYLTPIVTGSFIYDNGASLENKGYTFSMKRLETHLRRHYRKYGNSGWILQFDFKKFFENVSHITLINAIIPKIKGKRIFDLIRNLLMTFGKKGLGLGSQPCQILALESANKLDHYIKEVLRIRNYQRYMDDGYLISNSKEELTRCLEKIRELCKKLGIKLNEKKTRIVKLSHGFTFLKSRIYLLESGKIIKKIRKKSIVIERRKLKKFRKFIDDGFMTIEDVWNSFQSWRAYARTFNSYKTVFNLEQLYEELYGRKLS